MCIVRRERYYHLLTVRINIIMSTRVYNDCYRLEGIDGSDTLEAIRPSEVSLTVQRNRIFSRMRDSKNVVAVVWRFSLCRKCTGIMPPKRSTRISESAETFTAKPLGSTRVILHSFQCLESGPFSNKYLMSPLPSMVVTCRVEIAISGVRICTLCIWASSCRGLRTLS